MKKLLTALTLLLAFTINANAQEKKAAPSTAETTKKATPSSAELAKKDALELTKYLGLNDSQNTDFTRLFQLKYETLEEKSLSAERKDALSKAIEAKLRASLDAKQTDKLEKNPELFKRLTH